MTHPVYITRRIQFCAAHRLYSAQLSEEENWRIFNKCSFEKGHGHNFIVWVTLKGVPDSVTGMVMNLSVLKQILNDEILVPMDHKFLNADIPEFKTCLPSIENMCLVFWKRLAPRLNGLLYEIKIEETENNTAFYREE